MGAAHPRVDPGDPGRTRSASSASPAARSPRRATSRKATPEASPKTSPTDRKAILSDVLDPRGFWPDKAAKANEERKQAERALEADRVRIGEREEFLAANTGTADAEAGAHLVQRTAREAFERAEEHLAGTQVALAANAAAVKRAKAADQAWHTAGEEALRATKALHEARAQAEKLEAARVEEVELDWQAGRVAELERRDLQQHERALQVQADERAKGEADQAVERQHAQVLALERDYTDLDDKQDLLLVRWNHLAHSENGHERCDRCQQLLGEEARLAAIESIDAERIGIGKAMAAKRGGMPGRRRYSTVWLRRRPAIPIHDSSNGHIDYRAQLLAARARQREAGCARRTHPLHGRCRQGHPRTREAARGHRADTRRASR